MSTDAACSSQAPKDEDPGARYANSVISVNSNAETAPRRIPRMPTAKPHRFRVRENDMWRERQSFNTGP